MTPQELTQLGRACYGNFWQGQMSLELGINSRTLRRYVAGEYPIPDEIATRAKRLARDRANAIKDTLP